MHIETQHIGMVQSVHSTLYPRPQYDAPILTMDLVTLGEGVTFALVDACPLTSNLALSREYDEAFQDMQAQYGLTSTKRHTLPEYDRSIFSRRCFLRTTGIDPTLFSRFALDCVAMHVQFCNELEVSKEYAANRNAQHRFSRQQRLNSKRRSLLLNALGGDTVLVDAYLKMVFD